MTPEQVDNAIAGILTAITEMNRSIEADRQAREIAIEADRQAREIAIEADRQARAEAHARHEVEMAAIRQQNAETAAIANSNARANQALGDKLSDLIQIVGQFAESTNTRLAIAENRIDALENQ